VGYDKQSHPTSTDPQTIKHFDRKVWKTSSIHEPTKMTLHNRHWLVQCKKFSALHVLPKTKKQEQIQVSRMQHGIVCYPMFQGISHKTVFLSIN